MNPGALCLLILAWVLPARGDVVCGGSDRWSIKTTADTSPASLAAASKSDAKTVEEILGLQRPHWQAPKKQYQTKQISGEGEPVRVRGWLYKVGHDPKDSDYHLQLVADLNDCTNKSIIVEVPDDRCVIGGNLVPFVHTVRNELDILLGHQPPLQGGQSPPKATEVIVTGRLFYDLVHEKTDGTGAPRGHGLCKAGTLWEVHPVYALEIPTSGTSTVGLSVAASERKRRRAVGALPARKLTPRRSTANVPQ